MFYSQIIGKNVISLKTADIIGKVKCVYIEPSTYEVKYIGVSNADMHILAIANMLGNTDNIVVASTSVFEDSQICASKHMYSNDIPVIDVDGVFLGRSNDLNITANKRERIFTIGEKRYSLKSIVATSADLIIVNPNYKKILNDELYQSVADIIEATKATTVEGSAPIILSENAIPPTAILSEDAPQPLTAATAPATYARQSAIPTETVEVFSEATSNNNSDTVSISAPLQYSSSQIPARPISDYSFLLGKIVKREISDISRTFIINSGTVISERVISDAKRAGKLVQLSISI